MEDGDGNGGRVVRFEEFVAKREQRSRERAIEPREPGRALAPEQIAHRFMMLAYLRRQAAEGTTIQ